MASNPQKSSQSHGRPWEHEKRQDQFRIWNKGSRALGPKYHAQIPKQFQAYAAVSTQQSGISTSDLQKKSHDHRQMKPIGLWLNSLQSKSQNLFQENLNIFSYM